MKTRIACISLLLLFPSLLFSQVDSLRIDKNYLKKYWTDAKAVIASPARWDAKDWTKFGAYSGITASLLFVDEPIADRFQDFREYAGGRGEDISKKIFEPFGAEYSLGIIGSMMIYGALAKDSRSRTTGLLALESFLLSSVLVRVPKYIAGRKRPDYSDEVSPFDFHGLGKGSSFPSGHTVAVFSVASVIANQYSDYRWVPMVSYSIAGLTALSRVYDQKHWASDVFAGAVMGILVGNLVCGKNNDSAISLVPYYSNSLKGIKLALTL